MKWWGWVLMGLAVGAAITWIAALSREETVVRREAERRAAAMVADSVGAARKAVLDSTRLSGLEEAARVLKELTEHDSMVAQLRRVVMGHAEMGKALRDQLARMTTAVDSVPVLVAALAATDAVVAGQRRMIATMDTSAIKARGTIATLLGAVAASDSARWEAEGSAMRWKAVADSATRLVGRPERKKWLGLIPAPTVEYGPLVCVGCGGKPMTYGGGAMLVFR